MTRRPTINFRGQSALLVLGPGRDCGALGTVLERLGLHVHTVLPAHYSQECAAPYDVLFIDGDEGSGLLWTETERPDATIIALTGSEAPSRLARLIQHSCDSHIIKPVRNSGVYPALLLATHAASEKRIALKSLASLHKRIAGRKVVMQAAIALMQDKVIDESQAYEAMRSEAMTKRVPIEDVARNYMSKRGPQSPGKRRQIVP